MENHQSPIELHGKREKLPDIEIVAEGYEGDEADRREQAQKKTLAGTLFWWFVVAPYRFLASVWHNTWNLHPFWQVADGRTEVDLPKKKPGARPLAKTKKDDPWSRWLSGIWFVITLPVRLFWP